MSACESFLQYGARIPEQRSFSLQTFDARVPLALHKPFVCVPHLIALRSVLQSHLIKCSSHKHLFVFSTIVLKQQQHKSKSQSCLVSPFLPFREKTWKRKHPTPYDNVNSFLPHSV